MLVYMLGGHNFDVEAEISLMKKYKVIKANKN